MPLNHNDHFVVNAADPSASRRQIIEFKLSEEVLEEILNGKESIRLDLNHAKLLVGNTPYDFTHMPGINNMEVYKRPAGTKQLDLVGNITSKCTIQRTHSKQGQKKAIKHEPTRTTQIIDPKDLKAKSVAGRRVQSPPRAEPPVPTATAAAAAAAAAASGTIVPLRTRIIANYSGGRYVLRPETYREVKIHDWKSYSAKQRDIVINNAIAAFDTLGLPADAPERDILRPEMTKRTSPPRVAEGNHAGNADYGGSKWRSGGGGGGAGSESEGFDNGRINYSNSGGSSLKPPATQKRTSAKKSPGTTASSTLSSKLKSGGKSTGSSSTNKTSRREKAAAAAAIMDSVRNLSAVGASTPSGSLKPPTVGGTPGMASSPTMAGRRPSVNGNGLPSAPRRGSEAKKSGGTNNKESGGTNKGSGGVGNGYKIPKLSSGTTIPRKPQSPSFTVPPIKTQADYEDISRQFRAKYQDMTALRAKIDKKKELFDQLGAELEHAVGTDREMELKRKVQEAFGEDVVDRKVLRRTGEPRNGVSEKRAAEAIAEQNNHLSLRTLVDRYKTLHNEVDTMKRALCEAGAAQAERTGQTEYGSGGGGNG
ncbi:hypothetical protein BGZ95_009141 [Linnemannia exigua]|uniref:RNA polymerase II elongation factor ELL N-terminal domain-containing protein n=1 Tax=Linnemannia exigua TaxID=604196 RepID=A0AAD4DD95_9FUNG|nr:hypothetical protein BGZ95_009141 [Linnemannia exigua]